MSDLLILAIVQIFAIFTMGIIVIVFSGSPIAAKGITALAAAVVTLLKPIRRDHT